MIATTTRNNQGFLTGQSATTQYGTSIHNLSYEFNPVTGNLASRTGMITQKESFRYDKLNRLDTIMTGTPATLQTRLTSSTNGNISFKTGIGQYNYDATDPGLHALLQVVLPVLGHYLCEEILK